MKVITAKYNGATHEIIIGKNILEQLITYLSMKKYKSKLCIITDKNVAFYHLSSLLKELKSAKIKTEILILRPGEKTKSWFNLKKVSELIISNEIERNDYVVSFG